MNITSSQLLTSWNADIYFVTWNVSTKLPDSTSLKDLLGIENFIQNDQKLPDVYVIGLQEVNSQPQNVVLGFFKDDPWTQKFKDVLKDHDYIAIKSENMQGLLLIFFAKRKHILHLRNIETEYTRTGLKGFWGNKGAISIRLNFYKCAISVVNAHLAAHDNQLQERIDNYQQILEHHHYHVPRYREIFDHDYVFWIGDLNFRLMGDSMTPDDIKKLIEENKLTELLELDQLNFVRAQNMAFHQLEERNPAFPPTFKFERGTSYYDMKRRPAWTDRILYKFKQDAYPDIALGLNQTSYKSHPNYSISDHKPVTSEFTVKIFDEPSEKTIEFSTIPIWYISEDNIVTFTIPAGLEKYNSDWIGIYKNDFSSFADYIAYEYASNCEDKILSTDRRNIRQCLHLEFSESIDLIEDENYILLYFQSTGIRGITSLAGMSNVFRAEKRPPSPRFEAVD